MMNCYKSSFQEYITIIVLKIERTRKDGIPPPRSGCLETPLALPKSLYGRTDERTDADVRTQFFGSTGYQICFPMVLRELRYKQIWHFGGGFIEPHYYSQSNIDQPKYKENSFSLHLQIIPPNKNWIYR